MKIKNFLFTTIFAINSFSVAALIIVFNLMSENSLSIDISILYSLTYFLFYTFSANTRNLLFSKTQSLTISNFLTLRFYLGIFLIPAALILSLYINKISLLFSLAIILKRFIEWLEELFITYLEKNNLLGLGFLYISFQLISILFFVLNLFLKILTTESAFYLMAILPLLISCKFHLNNISSPKTVLNLKVLKPMLPFFISTFLQSISVYIYRTQISYSTDNKIFLSNLFSAFILGSIFNSIVSNSLAVSVADREFNLESRPILFYRTLSIIFFLSLLFLLVIFLFESFSLVLFKPFYFFYIIGLTGFFSIFNAIAQVNRSILVLEKNTIMLRDFIVSSFNIFSVPLTLYLLPVNYVYLSLFLNFIFSFFVYTNRRIFRIFSGTLK